MSVSKADGQRLLSQILSAKRKKDPSGLLRAQRNGTLNEYLREDLAKHGLAVAGDPAPKPTAPATNSSAKAAASAAGAAASTRTSAPTSASATGGFRPTGGGKVAAAASAGASATSQPQAAAAGQRWSYRAPATPQSASTTADPSATAKTRGRLASLESSDTPSLTPPPPPAYQEQQRQQQLGAGGLSGSSSGAGESPRRAPGKLDASRFGNFGKTGSGKLVGEGGVGGGGGRGGGEGERGGKGPASSLPTPPPAEGSRPDTSGRGRDGKAQGVDGSHHHSQSPPRRWTAGPEASPSSSPVPDDDQEEREKREGRGGLTGGTAGVAGNGGAGSQEDTSSVGDLTKKFRGGARVNSGKFESAGPAGAGGRGRDGGFVKSASDSAAVAASGAGAGAVSAGRRSNSGKIAELARKFEK